MRPTWRSFWRASRSSDARGCSTSPAARRSRHRHELDRHRVAHPGSRSIGVAPIAAVDQDRPATRPAHRASLDNRALRLAGLPPLRAWRDALTEYVKEWERRGARESGCSDWRRVRRLTTAACLASLGHRSSCADLDEQRVRAPREGRGADPGGRASRALVADGLGAGRLRFVVGAAPAARDAEFVFLCVQTPQSETGAADLSVGGGGRPRDRAGPPAGCGGRQQVDDAGRLHPTRRARAERRRRAPNDVGVASNPEFLREGNAVRDFLSAAAAS